MMKTMRFVTTPLFSAILFVSCTNPKGPYEQVSIPLFEDLGSHHHTVTTSSERAQKYFDQGLRLVYGFNHDEAARAFREAARLDPNRATAWWGVAYALGPNYNLPMAPERNAKAVEAVQKAQSLQSRASESERAYIAAIATRYSPDPNADRAALDRAYGKAMKELSRRFPDDNDAAVLYAESLMDLKPWPSSQQPLLSRAKRAAELERKSCGTWISSWNIGIESDQANLLLIP